MTCRRTIIRAEWNALVPLAQARGIRRVRPLTALHETVGAGEARLAWLRQQLGITTAAAPVVEVAPAEFTFGVEIECLVDLGYSDVAQRIADAGVACLFEGYNHFRRDHWKIVTDASVGGRGYSMEVVSPVLRGADGIEQLRKVCDALTAMGARVNKTCGLHVHVGARGRGAAFLRNIAELYVRHQATIDTFMSPSRRGTANTYCQPTVMAHAVARLTDEAAVAAAMGAMGRYRKLNFASFSRHGTVEFRHHQGTVEARKAVAWVELCLGLAAAAAAGRVATEDTVAGVCALAGVDAGYFTMRAAQFAGRTQPAAVAA